MIPPPTKTGPFWRRRIRKCYCMANGSLNPHGWVVAYCPPEPMPPPEGHPDYDPAWRP